MNFKSISLLSMILTACSLFCLPLNVHGSGANGFGGCTNDNNPGLCIDYTGTIYTPAAVKNACENSNGHFLAQGCSGAGRIGSCVAGKPATKMVYRYNSSYDGGISEARKACAAVRGSFGTP